MTSCGARPRPPRGHGADARPDYPFWLRSSRARTRFHPEDEAGSGGASNPVGRRNLLAHVKRGVRGILLYGPPGTGKTWIASELFFNSGLVPLNAEGVQEGNIPDATSLNRGLVGQAEAEIQRMAAKATLRPYLLHVIALDEVNYLLNNPASNSHGDNHTKDIRFKLLSVIDSFPNIVFIGACNFRLELYEPFQRRFSKQYAVLPVRVCD